MTQIVLTQMAAWVIGCGALLVLLCIAQVWMRGRRRKKSGERKKRLGVMDRVLIIEIVVLLVYTVADMIVFWHTGSEPTTLTACIFAAAGLENGVLGWIKTNKDKVQREKGQDEDQKDSGADG